MRSASPEPFDGARLRGHRARAGARLRAVRRHRLDRQEHLRDQPGARFVDLPVRDHLQPAARRATRRRSISAGRCTLCLEACPTQAHRRARRARFDALHFVPDHRAQGRHSRGARGRRSATTSTAATSARKCARGTLAAPCPPIRRGSRVAAWDGATFPTLATASDDELRAAMKGSAMRRTKVTGLRRNIAAARPATGG